MMSVGTRGEGQYDATKRRLDRNFYLIRIDYKMEAGIAQSGD